MKQIIRYSGQDFTEHRITANLNELNILFIAAFRYAVNRCSTMPSYISDLIRNNKEILTENTLKIFVKEIDEEKDRMMDIDRETWLHLSRELAEYLNKIE